MLTLFTTTKPFHGHNGVIQRNALHSWSLLQPRCEVIVVGNDEGAAEICREFGFRHHPEIACNEYGTPLIGDIFEQGQRLASNPTVCYINADIILFDDFLKACEYAIKSRRRFLMVGQRIDFDLETELSFEPGWQEKLREEARRTGKMHGKTGVDYFIFPKGALGKIPPFAIGRGVWDNWLMFQARMRWISFIDATEAIDCVHQNHDYAHVSNDNNPKTFLGPEREVNLKLGGGEGHLFGLLDATAVLSRNGDRLTMRRQFSRRHIMTLGNMYPWMTPALHFAGKISSNGRRMMGR